MACLKKSLASQQISFDKEFYFILTAADTDKKSSVLFPASLNVCVDALFPIGTERLAGADAAYHVADDLVIQCGTCFITLIVYCVVCADAEAA